LPGLNPQIKSMCYFQSQVKFSKQLKKVNRWLELDFGNSILFASLLSIYSIDIVNTWSAKSAWPCNPVFSGINDVYYYLDPFCLNLIRHHLLDLGIVEEEELVFNNNLIYCNFCSKIKVEIF